MVAHVALSMGNQQDDPEEKERNRSKEFLVRLSLVPPGQRNLSNRPAIRVKPLALAYVVGLLTCFVNVHELGLRRHKELTRSAQILTL